MLFGKEQLVICRRIVTIWLERRECFSLKNLKVNKIYSYAGWFFLCLLVHIDLAPLCLEDNFL